MPIKIDAFEEVDPSVFAQYPDHKAPTQVDPAWQDVLERLEQGTVIRLPYTSERELRGLRLAVGQRAAGRGFRVETRHDAHALVIRPREQSMNERAPWPTDHGDGGKRRGRPRKHRPSEMALEDQETAIREDEGELAIEQDEAAL